VLDRLFPETVSQTIVAESEDQIELWVAQLGDDEFDKREAATRNLIASAWPRRELVNKFIDSSDSEVRLRARYILDAWAPKSRDPWKTHLPGLPNYLLKIKDRERLELLAQRMVRVLERGMPIDDDRKLPELCLAAIGEGGNEASCELLQPLLKHQDVAVAVLVAEEIGSHRDSRFFPRLLIQALEDERDEVARAALDWSTSCWDEERAPLVQKAIRRLFDKRSETLKFHASFALMHNYDDAEALAYLLEQTRSQDKQRAYTAISWIGDSCNYQKPVSQAILDRLSPHLISTNDTLRRAASDALGTYGGEDVVRRLIPMLGDSKKIIADEAQRKLPDQKDKKMLRRQLEEAAKNDPNAEVRSRSRQLLARMTAK